MPRVDATPYSRSQNRAQQMINKLIGPVSSMVPSLAMASALRLKGGAKPAEPTNDDASIGSATSKSKTPSPGKHNDEDDQKIDETPEKERDSADAPHNSNDPQLMLGKTENFPPIRNDYPEMEHLLSDPPGAVFGDNDERENSKSPAGNEKNIPPQVEVSTDPSKPPSGADVTSECDNRGTCNSSDDSENASGDKTDQDDLAPVTKESSDEGNHSASTDEIITGSGSNGKEEKPDQPPDTRSAEIEPISSQASPCSKEGTLPREEKIENTRGDEPQIESVISDSFVLPEPVADMKIGDQFFQESSFFGQSLFESFVDLPSSSNRRLRHTFGSGIVHAPLDFIPVEELPVIRETTESKKRTLDHDHDEAEDEPQKRKRSKPDELPHGEAEGVNCEVDGGISDIEGGTDALFGHENASSSDDEDKDEPFEMSDEETSLKPPSRVSRSATKRKIAPGAPSGVRLTSSSQSAAGFASGLLNDGENDDVTSEPRVKTKRAKSLRRLPTRSALSKKPESFLYHDYDSYDGSGDGDDRKPPPASSVKPKVKAETAAAKSSSSPKRKKKPTKTRVLRRLLTPAEEEELEKNIEERFPELLVCEEPLKVDKKNGVGGMIANLNKNWEKNYRSLIIFTEVYGHALVPKEFRDVPGLARFVINNRKWKKEYDANIPTQLSESRIKRLKAVGFVWDAKKDERFWNIQNECEDAWERFIQRVEELKVYKAEYGDCLVPKKYPPNQPLAAFVSKQRAQYRKKKNGEFHSLTDEKEKILEDLGFVFDTKNTTIRRRNLYQRYAGRWDAMFEKLVEFKKETGHTFMPRRYPKDQTLSSWVQRQRAQYKAKIKGLDSSLSFYRFDKLKSIQFQYERGVSVEDLPEEAFNEPFDMNESNLRQKRFDQGILYDGDRDVDFEDELDEGGEEDGEDNEESDEQEEAGAEEEAGQNTVAHAKVASAMYGAASDSDTDTESEG